MNKILPQERNWNISSFTSRESVFTIWIYPENITMNIYSVNKETFNLECWKLRINQWSKSHPWRSEGESESISSQNFYQDHKPTYVFVAELVTSALDQAVKRNLLAIRCRDHLWMLKWCESVSLLRDWRIRNHSFYLPQPN